MVGRRHGAADTVSQYTYDQLKALWIEAGGNPVAAPMAAAVGLAESSGNSDSTNTNSNGTVDRGLWQINSIHGALSVFDPLANARAAVQISANGTTWRPWCSAWSDNRCGGTFLGTGSHVLNFLPAGGNYTGGTPNTSNTSGGSTGSTSNVGLSLDPSTWASAILTPVIKSLWFAGMAGTGVLLIAAGLGVLIMDSRAVGLVRGLIPGASAIPQEDSEATYEGQHRA